MRLPALLLALSLAGVGVALLRPGWSDLLLLAGPCALAAAFLLVRAARAVRTIRHVVVDGSNVMHWRGGRPDLAPVRAVVDRLAARGWRVGVMFDANAGYLLSGRYRDDADLARELGLPSDRVLVVPKGTPADPAILQAARDMGARIVTNDRFRGWRADFPEAGEPGRLIRGGMRDGALRLDLPDEE